MIQQPSLLKFVKMPSHIEPLQATHAIFNDKTASYLKKRQILGKFSVRNKMKKLLISEHDYDDNLDLTCDNILRKNKFAKKLGGKETIKFVRRCLLKHSADTKVNGPLKNKQHMFKDMVHPSEVHPSSGLDRHLLGQKVKLQKLSADVEAMVFIRFLETRLADKELIDDPIDDDDDLYVLHPEAEEALISLRLARVG